MLIKWSKASAEVHKTMFRPRHTDLNCIFKDFKSHWLHDAYVIWWLACEWLKGEGRKQSGSSVYTILPLAVVGSRAGTEASNWSNVNHL